MEGSLMPRSIRLSFAPCADLVTAALVVLAAGCATTQQAKLGITS
jgi:hypothetical protein